MLNDTDIEGLEKFLANSGEDVISRTRNVGGVLAVGAVLGSWRVEGLLGFGGSGEVYRVVHSVTRTEAAVKILTSDGEMAKRRFLDEIDFLAQNQLPQFPRYFESGEHDGRAYLVLELLEPMDVPTDEKEIAEYLTNVCSCVRALHLSGIVHRDLKPRNIMRRANGEVVLIDFGLAKDTIASALPRTDVSIVSGKAISVGTPGYAAPEQLTGGEISPAVDIHALGRIANVAFGGNPPRSWGVIIRRATSSIPEQRYQSVDNFAAAIRHRDRGRHIAVCSLVFSLLAGVVVLAGILGRRLPEEIAWDRLCGEVVSTNIVREELVEVKWLDSGGMMIPAQRRYRMVTNYVEVVPIQLGGVTNAFANPVRLEDGREYWVTGPGVLDGTFYAEGTNVTMRLRNCIMRNRAAEPMGKVGIDYDLQDGAGLDLPELDEPDDHGRHHIERSGSPTRLTFKKINWKSVVWKDE